MPERHVTPPDFRTFHQSVIDEMSAVKNRIRNLIQDRHWLTDGEYKETVLRTVVRRHIPNSMVVGRGFIVNRQAASTQIDVLIVDGNAPVLFREGDLRIVTPDAVRAVIEVKTRVGRTDFTEAIEKLACLVRMCDVQEQRRVWSGLFVFESRGADHEASLRALSHAQRESDGTVNCVSWGRDLFVRYWSNEQGTPCPTNGPFWRTYELRGLAPSYFIGNLMSVLAGRSGHAHEYAWFPEVGGKEIHSRFQLRIGSLQPEDCRRVSRE